MTSDRGLTRPRPQLHFTVTDGWINDPYGIGYVDGRYQMYFQYLPGQVVWGPNCHWGHASSDDLVHWVEQPPALVPADFEVGCWSGSVVHSVEPPVLFYTRVREGNHQIGQVARAALDRRDGSWKTSAGDVVVEAPPPELGLRCFRDPFVFPSGDGWTMLMAAGLPDDSGGVLQYRSSDLVRWSYDGVLCSRPSSRDDEVWTGSVWECPQLFQLGGRWVLLISVADDIALHYVAGAVGDYDGHQFTPESWQRLSHGSSAYATTAFTDKDGRRCVLSWLREEPQDNPELAERAGALSVVSTIGLDRDGRLILRPHPAITELVAESLAGVPGAEATRYDVGDAPVEVRFTVEPGLRCRLDDEEMRLELSLDLTRRALLLRRPGLGDESMPADAGDDVQVLVDADIVEVFSPRAYGAYRIRPAARPEATSLVLAVTEHAVYRVRSARSFAQRSASSAIPSRTKAK